MKKFLLLLSFFIISLMVNVAGKKKVLIFLLLGTKSHILHLVPVAEELASRGYEVTFYAGGKVSNEEKANLQYKIVEEIEEHIKRKFVLAPLKKNWLNQYPYLWMNYMKVAIEGCEIAYQNKVVRDLLKENITYDIFITDALWHECFLSIAYHFRLPVVLSTGNSLHPEHMRTLSIPHPYSYVPQFVTALPYEMSFVERIQNMWEHFTFYFIHQWLYYPELEKIVEQHLPGSPSINDLVLNTSIHLATSDGIIVNARPSMPFLVDTGGLHCRPYKKLPKNLKNIVDSSNEDGFILLSTGSFVGSFIFTPEVKQNFLEALSHLNLTVIWANAGKNNKYPENIKPFGWVPQQDLLAHPKARLFLTHGGMHGFHEAIYHGVPAVGIGVFADQKPNIQRLNRRGFALSLDENNLTAESILSTLQEVLYKPSYREAAKRLSNILQDQPETPLERSVAMIEYVIRHKGASHLHYPQHLNIIKYFSLDILGLIGVVLSIFLYLFLIILRMIVKKSK